MSIRGSFSAILGSSDRSKVREPYAPKSGIVIGKGVGVRREEAQRLVAALRRMPLSYGHEVVGGEVVEHDGAPILLLSLTDPREPSRQLCAWWDFAAFGEFLGQPDEGALLASPTHIFLEELVWAGGPVEEWALDEAGVRWGELDCRGLHHRLPPHVR
jgi:hypothetical protein